MCTHHSSSDTGTLNCHESWNFIMLLFPQKKSMRTIDSLRKSGNVPFSLTHAKNMKHLKSHLSKGLLFADTKLSQLSAFLPLFSQHPYEAPQYYSPWFKCGDTEQHTSLWLGHGLQAYTVIILVLLSSSFLPFFILLWGLPQTSYLLCLLTDSPGRRQQVWKRKKRLIPCFPENRT